MRFFVCATYLSTVHSWSLISRFLLVMTRLLGHTWNSRCKLNRFFSAFTHSKLEKVSSCRLNKVDFFSNTSKFLITDQLPPLTYYRLIRSLVESCRDGSLTFPSLSLFWRCPIAVSLSRLVRTNFKTVN